MSQLFYSIRGKVILSFGVFIIMVITAFAVNLWLDQERMEIGQIENTLTQIDRNVQLANKLEKDFFKDETINPNYYTTGQSQYLNKRKAIIDTTLHILQQLSDRKALHPFGKEQELIKLIDQFQEYQNVFLQLKALVQKRGFKDWGIEGEMRASIHAIENSKSGFDKTMMLMCRRHEKDFILRKEYKYVERLQGQVDELRRNIIDRVASASKKQNMLSLLNNYESKFMDLVRAEEAIGFDKNRGLRYSLSRSSREIEQAVASISKEVKTQSGGLQSNFQLATFSVMGLSILFGILLSVYVSKSLGQPIKNLSESIYQAIKNNFSRDSEIVRIESRDEVGYLSKDFSVLLAKVQDSIDEIADKSEKLEAKQQLLMDSMRYAQQIQQAILPSSEDIHNHFADHFVIYRPKDVVSGDFYWLNRKHGKTFVAVVDCTGHGVPGALMSMIGATLLYKIVNENKVFDPALILEILHVEIQEELRQKKEQGEKNTDGMDLGVCVIEKDESNPENRIVHFAGAKQNLFYTKDNFLHQATGTKRSIGGKSTPKQLERKFETTTLHLKTEDRLYLFTDGMADQQNNNRKKLGSKRMEDRLAVAATLPMQEQSEALTELLKEHQGNEQQRDDITFLGLKL